MSLADLTRNAFQSGLSAKKWIGLCSLYIAKSNGHESVEDIQTALSNSVLVLYRFYPGDPGLQSYLITAIEKGVLPLSVFVATFLQAARSTELHVPATLDMLCRVALDAHYSSGLPSIGSVVSYSESPIVVLGTVQDALALLRTAHSLPMSHFHQLITSASELLILLLSCVTDMSQVSTAQALVHFADANDMLHTLHLSQDVRQVLDTFVMSLSLLIGDDAKAAREAQMMHTIQLALGKGDILGPSSNTDIVTSGLILNHLVTNRASAFGAGSDLDPVAILVATLRWTSWTPVEYYTQLLLTTFTCFAQVPSTDLGAVILWKSFVIGRLPQLLTTFEQYVQSDNTTENEWRTAMQTALAALLQRADLTVVCERIASTLSPPDSMHDQDTESAPRSFLREFTLQLLTVGLLDAVQTLAVGVDPNADTASRLVTEAQAHGAEIGDEQAYLDMKLGPETSIDDAHGLLEKVWREPGLHAGFSTVVQKRFVALTAALDVESMSHICKLLYLYDPTLDIISLYLPVSTLVAHAILFLQQYDCETVGDPQTAVSHLGDVVMFVQATLARFHLPTKFEISGKTLQTDMVRTTDDVQPVESLRGEDAAAFGAWFKALFDSSSEGIEDTILRSTKPRTLLRISSTLFSHAIYACAEKKIDVEVLNNGVSYFLGPLLNWTLVGVIKALLREIEHNAFSAPTHLEVLQTLLLSPSCPRPILQLCSPGVLRLFSNSKDRKAIPPKVNISAIIQVALQSLGAAGRDVSQQGLSMNPQQHWMDQSRQAIRNAFAAARAGKTPALDVAHCLLSTPPTAFLRLLWSELRAAASLGEIETCRRIATFVLTMPRAPSQGPPLLPVFMRSVLPALLAPADQHEQSVAVELLVAITSSVLTAALHVELALLSVCGEQRYVLGQSSAAVARRLAGDLRAKTHSPTSAVIMQRLGSSSAFVANFPMFA
ncbi:hypothetical protein PLICRDRAFT_121648 [Plicaturopsis crispa FD-325 SS-3]|nr:hypothetical protein PLICRDRAFT_121648 [Plicaturopsis crispa FD-325 SS-3]